MKARATALLILIATSANINAQLNPIATTDRVAAPAINPASLAVGNAQGLGVIASAPADLSTVDSVGIITSFPLSAYDITFDQYAEPLHRLSIGAPLNRIAAAGGAWSWRHGGFRRGMPSLALLVRPAAALSFGARADFPQDESWRYHAGAALRPLSVFGIRDSLLTLSVDVAAEHDRAAGIVAVSLPAAGVEIEPAPGITLRGGYDFETGTISLAFETRAPRLSLGGGAVLGNGGDALSLYASTHLSIRENDTILDARDPRLVEYDGPTTLTESPTVGLVDLSSMTLATESVHDVAAGLRAIAEDPLVDGVVFDDLVFTGSFASFLEIEAALHAMADAGKEVVFYFTQVDTLTYALAASTATKILLHPLGIVAVTGLGSGRLYLNELFDRYGVNVVDLASHPYKTANDSVTEPGMTAAEREALTTFLDDRYDTLLTMIGEGRRESISEPIRDVLARGPYLVADEALSAGLVDGLIQPQALQKELGDRPITPYSPAQPMANSWAPEPRDALAVLFAVGPIHTGEGVQGESIGSDTMVAALEAAAADSAVRGILLRVDSGGGSALGSDVIAEAVRRITEEEPVKPVVISMGGSAASGGYYISVRADRIIASPVTVTGSIGVASFTFSLAKALSELGIAFDYVATAPSATFASPLKPLDPDELVRLRAGVMHMYRSFVDEVVAGRDLDIDSVEDAAQGRIWTGRQALDRELIDKLGTFPDALEALAELAGVGEDYRIKTFVTGRGAFPGNLLQSAVRIPVLSFLMNYRHFEPGEMLYLMPYVTLEE